MDGRPMKRIYPLLLMLLLFAPQAVLAQGGNRGQECLSRSPRSCLSVTDLGLTAEQRTAVRKIESRYGEQINQLQNKLITKRLEVQQVFRDPQVDEEKIRARAMEVSDLQNQCRQAMLDYQLALRALLSPEQLRTWCASMEPCLMKWGGKPWQAE